MKKYALLIVLGLVALPVFLAAQDIVEKIEIAGNDRVTTETVLYYLSVREGDSYSADQFRRDFRVLWSTGFFSNITFEESQGARGKIIKITVEENAVVRSVTYKTGKKVKEKDIVDKLKEKDQAILPYSYYSAFKVQRIKDTIADLLTEKGLLASKIESEVVRQGKNEVDVQIRIDEGPKVRVGEVAFEGDTKIQSSKLENSMKENRSHSMFNWVAGKDVYKSNKLEEDAEALKNKYQELGYMEAAVGQPRTEEYEDQSVTFQKQKMMRVIFPVSPGYLYRTGEIKVEGSKAVNVKNLMTLVRLKTGEVYSTKDRDKSIEDMGEAFRDGGYVYAQIIPVENLDPKNKIVNITFNVHEGEVAYLNRLEFRGNIYTKDKVIRREMIIREGDRFGMTLFKNSILRIKQLGLVDLDKDPDIKPDPNDPTKMDVTVNVKEMQRNNIQFTAGYSGYEGAFVAFSYSTVNFLGAGETLELGVQLGKLTKSYSFGFSEPYLFDKPITAGFNVYKRDIHYPWFWRNGAGIDLTTGMRLTGMWRGNLTFSFEKVKMTTSANQDYGGLPTSYYQYYSNQKYNITSVTPMIWRSTVDSPITPTRGTQYSASLKYAFPFMGGDVFLIKPTLEFTHYQPVVGRGPKSQVIGVHAQFMFIQPLRDTEVPYWERFFLGGERSIRGYDVYTIGPHDRTGYNVGGTKALVLNAEYIIPVGGPLYAIFFYDMGNTVLPAQKLSLADMYSSLGVEARLFIPALRVPFRLIFAYNNKKIYASDSEFTFRFAVGTTF